MEATEKTAPIVLVKAAGLTFTPLPDSTDPGRFARIFRDTWKRLPTRGR
jgi:hypothetical protein